MKQIKNIFYTLAAGFCIITTGCTDDVLINQPSNNHLDALEVHGMLKCPASPRELCIIEVAGGKGEGELVFRLSKGADRGVDVKLSIDESLVERYNAEHATDYKSFPKEQVVFEEEGKILIAPTDIISDPVVITLSSPEEWDNYLLPVRAEVITEGITLSEENSTYIFKIMNVDTRPNSDKGTGFVTTCYIEVNSDNPLNTGEYTMTKSGKSFIDIVNIFAANINYDSKNHRPYVSCNPNVQHILNHRDQFIKPLQDKGIRVCLTILGNHDEAGIAGLTDAMAIDFANELKAYVDAYGLDGVDFDDEWSDYNPDGVIWPEPSKERTARLIYECRKLMPDKLITVYDIGNSPTGTVDGIEVGKMIDYAYQAYYGSWSDQGLKSLTGMKRSQYGPYPLNINGGCTFHEDNLKRLRYNRYSGELLGDPFGVNMLYNMTPCNYQEAFSRIGEILYDDTVEWTGNVYDKFSTTPRKL